MQVYSACGSINKPINDSVVYLIMKDPLSSKRCLSQLNCFSRLTINLLKYGFTELFSKVSLSEKKNHNYYKY